MLTTPSVPIKTFAVMRTGEPKEWSIRLRDGQAVYLADLKAVRVDADDAVPVFVEDLLLHMS